MKNIFISFVCTALMACVTGVGAQAQTQQWCPNANDVGAVKIPGSVSFDPATGVCTLTGSGTNMWGTSDEFFMVWDEVSGDFTLSADVAFEGAGVNAHRKLGLIIRESLDPQGVYADVAVHGDGLTSLQYRPSQGAETLEAVAQPSGSPIPGHISFQRIGNKLILTADAASSETTLDLPAKCLVGLFICSHDAEVSETGYFSNVKLKQ